MVLVQKDLMKLGPGKHADDGKGGVTGLFLLVKLSGRRSWVLRLSADGKRAERGLGSLMDVPLSIARRKAIEIRQRRDAGLPLDKAPRGSHTTVAGVYEEVLAQRRATWKSPRSEAQ